MERWLSLPAATLSYNSLNTGAVASRNFFHQSKAPRCAVVEQLAYIQSIPFSATNGINDWVNSSLMPLVAENGMDWMYANCSTTAQRGAVVEQLAYIQSIPFSATNGINDWVNSSTVSLNDSEGEWPLARNTSYCAAKIPWIQPI